MALTSEKEGVTDEVRRPAAPAQESVLGSEKDWPAGEHMEEIPTSDNNLVYENVDEEPELHARTYIALAAMFLLNFVQIVALQGPPAVVCDHGNT